MNALVVVGAALLFAGAERLAAQVAPVTMGKSGKLVYTTTPNGDRLADFSYAGYRGGGVALPVVPVKRSLKPSGGDDTKAIQAAIDEVSALPLVDGVRGAVTLAAGRFSCEGTLSIAASGVVLRGAGAGTVIAMTGSPHLALRVAGKLEVKATGVETAIADSYVGSGTMSLHVADATGLAVGDTLEIVKQATTEWVHFMQMDTLGMRDGALEHWVSGPLKVRRRIAAIDGKLLTLTVPLLDSYDAKYLGAGTVQVRKVEVTGQIAEVGVEGLRVEAPARTIALQKDPEFDGLVMGDAVDSWVKDVAFAETTNSVAIGGGTERVTVTHVDVMQHNPVTTPAKPFDFACNGSQILFDRVTGTGDRVFYVATQARQQGPVVVLHATFHGDGAIEPHQRWSTGLLVDNSDVPEGSIQFVNRGKMGTGHGWTMGWGMVWNSSARLLVMQNPPGTANWSAGNRSVAALDTNAMGTEGAPNVQGEWKGTKVKPESLYLEQLKERLGPAAVKAIGY